ncbi:RecX family transcriptional regulator [Caldicellulosiruptoraceae bacterium PP1]
MKIMDKIQNINFIKLLLDNGQEVTIHKDIYFKNYLFETEELSQEQLSEIIKQNQFLLAKDTLLSYIKRYPLKSEKQYISYLITKGFDIATAQKAVAYFINNGYINEDINIKKVIKKYKGKKSIKELKYILKKNGFKENLINSIDFSEISDQGYLDKLIEKKVKKIKNKNDYNQINKLIRYLISKGFEYERIIEKIKELKLL